MFHNSNIYLSNHTFPWKNTFADISADAQKNCYQSDTQDSHFSVGKNMFVDKFCTDYTSHAFSIEISFDIV